MRRQKEYPLQKLTLLLRAGDVDFLRELYPTVGASEVIRNLVIDFVNKRRNAHEKIAAEAIREASKPENIDEPVID